MEEKTKLRVTLCQTDIKWGDFKANFESAGEMIAKAVAGAEEDCAHLVVLPEMWNTGFVMEPSQVAEKESSSPSLEWMKQTAEDNNIAICGSVSIEASDGSFRNRSCFVKPSSDVDFYDKHHLFTYGGEHKRYASGSTHTIVTYGGFRFLLLVCYDLRFPVWSRYGFAGEYDAIIVVANWPASRQQAWDVLTRARAIENQCYVIAVNRVGDDPVSHYLGGSRITDPIGNVIAECPLEIPAQISFDLDLADLQKMRRRFRVLDERDKIFQ